LDHRYLDRRAVDSAQRANAKEITALWQVLKKTPVANDWRSEISVTVFRLEG
jgi:hypothetical protein